MRFKKNLAVRKAVRQKLDDDIVEKVIPLTETAIRKRTPVRSGTLKGSITGRPTGWAKGEVATNTEYACVFNAQTSVITDKGNRTIGTIKEGDKVLTQDGEFHKVIATNKFLAKLKPDLIDIETEYRKDRTHKITLTTDHKVLVYRDYRHKWVEAGQILKTDQLMTRIKIDHKKGNRRFYQCINCGIRHQKQGEKYCSIECRDEYWTKGNNPHTGTKRNDETKKKMSRIIRKRLAINPESHPSRIVAKRGFVTDKERQTEEWLKKLGVSYEKQKPIGRYFADFHIPEWNAIIECDGAYWHRDQDKDINRDKDIRKILPNIRIIHIHFYSERHSPKLEPRPLPNVEYVAVNPSMKSYIDLSMFKPCKILSIKKWTYKAPNKAEGASAKLYDLTVEGMHSFYANGIIISNSYVEYGTSKFSARAMFRKGANDVEKRGMAVFK